MIGTEIGPYRLLKQLGEGGMGAVYLAEHTKLGRRAAIKVLLPHLSQHPAVVERFFNEARAATAISDPGIVQIFDFGYHTDGSAYIVMELLDGEPLDRRLHALGRLGVVDAARICRQVATSLAGAHARNIVHRDLKPENIFLVRDVEVPGGERAKILDFGIAKLIGDTSSKVKTNTGAFMGTAYYASPEQCRGAGEVDHRTDIYALGCILFQLVTGRPPFDGEGIGDLITKHMTAPAPTASTSVPGISPAIDQVIARCLAKEPGARYQTALELATALGAIAAAPDRGVRVEPSAATVLATPSQGRSTLGGAAGQSMQVTAPPSRGRGAVIAIAGIAILAAGVGVYFATRTSEHAPIAAAAAGATDPEPERTAAADAAPAPVAIVVDAAPAPTETTPVGPIDLPAGGTAPVASPKNGTPKYPRGGKGSATVTLRLVVGSDGTVIGDPAVVEGKPPFTTAAVATVTKWTFEPARHDGHPLEVFHQVTLTFKAPKRTPSTPDQPTSSCPPDCD